MNQLLERFCRYVQVETTANEDTTDYPSSPGQFELGRLLADELRQLGLQDVTVSDRGIVMATVPATHPNAPTIAWLAHLDTSPEASGAGVKPQVVRDYDGGKLPLAANPAAVLEAPAYQGKTIITTDGTTLLGADDKAGVAVVMTAAARLLAENKPRGPVRLVFTCDEEIGRGTEHLDLDAIGATAAYTLDGEGAGVIENETFSADLAEVVVTGVNIHPGLAYDRMVNALRVAGAFLAALPPDLSPERTRDREGFVHPYTIEGGVEQVKIKILLRSFEASDLRSQEALLRETAEKVAASHAGSRIDITVREQYRNMAEYLSKEPRAVALASKAYEACGVEPKFSSVRGGTDGSKLSEKGLPTPNLATGMHNFHSRLEFACLEEMESAVDVLLELAALWSQES
ncbi:MAG: peptidase T [Vulcanimicrobiota bacterium]